MERFKKALKSAISDQAVKISILENAELELIKADGSSAKLLELPPADNAWIDTLLTFLFPKNLNELETSSYLEGSLNIPGVGVLKALAFNQNTARGVSLYFPETGDNFYAEDLSNFNTPKVASANPAYGLGDSLGAADMFSSDTNEVTSSEDDQTPSSDMFSLPSEHLEEPSNQDPVENSDMFNAGTDENMFAMSTPSEAHEEAPAEEETPSFPVSAPEEQISFTPASEPQIEHSPSQSHASPADTPSGHKKIVFGNDDPSTSIVRDHDFPIDTYLKKMIEAGASDVHLTLGQPLIFRIDGDLRRMSQNPISETLMEELLLPIMPEANKKEFAEIYDTDFAYEIPGVGRFRVNMFKDNYGVGAVLRQIPAEVLTADQLGLPPAIRKFCELHKGLVLVTGPTGSGKSTTLAAMIDLINKSRPDHILTIEDPIEFVHSQQKCLVNQREVGKHTGSFKRALKAALREDPDIVLIGELRDLETIHIALETAETGHLVFGTLHTNTAVSTIDRIIDQFPADQQSQIRTMVAASLKGVVAQTLIKKKGGGRVAAQEILVPNDAVANMIREGKNHMIENHMQTQKQDGNMLLNECLVSLTKADKVEVKEAYHKAIDKASFIDNAKRAGVNVSFLIEDQKNKAAS